MEEYEINQMLKQAGFTESQISKIHYKAYEEGHAYGEEEVNCQYNNLALFLIDLKESK